MNVNKAIHESMGLCWHHTGGYVNPANGVATCCKCQQTIALMDETKPDYTTPTHYCELMDWMRSANADLVQAFCKRNQNNEPVTIAEWLKLSRQEQVNLIAEAITEAVLK